ncbi:hypothetical protein SNE40_021287 [Patella caerulea]|uniref:BTB domain-containing protein n=1 Tax=Patella caerulea TaxID=87958 RepID=A0AAN8J486_PATCE
MESNTSSVIATTLTPTSDVCSCVEEDRFIDTERAANLLTGFSKLYQNKEFVDVILVVGSSEYPCHKNVLAGSSPYFMAMFSNNMAESHQEKVTLNDMDAQTLSLVLDYIYTGQVMLTEETVQNLLSASNLFQLISLRDGCAQFMMNHVTVSNCIGIYFFAKAHQCEILASKGKEMINNQFSTLCHQQEFLLLPADKLVEIIKDSDICVDREEVVFEACMEWLNHDTESRSDFLVDIINCVRFANISSYYFCDKIVKNKCLNDNEEIRKKLDTIRYYHMLRNRQQEMDLNLMPRKGMPYERGVMILANPYTEDALKKYNTMELLLPKSGEVITICRLPQSLYTPGVAVTGDNQIYLAGGAIRKINYRGSITMEGVCNGVYQFDQLEAAWTCKTRLLVARSQFTLTVVDGLIFAIGGQDGTEILRSVEKYDPNTNVWTMAAQLSQPLRFMSSVSYRGHLYVFGGENTTDFSRCAYKYDPASDTWTSLPNMKTPRVLAGSVVYKDKIYVIGGNSAISDKWIKEYLPEHCVSSVEIYDPATNEWSAGPELPNALCGAGIVKYSNTILIVGGEDDKSWMAGFCWLRQDEQGQEMWAEGQELPTVMSTFGCIVANMPHDILKQKDAMI